LYNSYFPRLFFFLSLAILIIFLDISSGKLCKRLVSFNATAAVKAAANLLADDLLDDDLLAADLLAADLLDDDLLAADLLAADLLDADLLDADLLERDLERVGDNCVFGIL
jgi:uncharacterized protein YjbI with pentapeptide repeats